MAELLGIEGQGGGSGRGAADDGEGGLSGEMGVAEVVLPWQGNLGHVAGDIAWVELGADAEESGDGGTLEVEGGEFEV